MRTSVRRFLVVIDAEGRVVASEDDPDALFDRYYNSGDLHPDVKHFARTNSTHGETQILDGDCIVHAKPVGDGSEGLTVLVFEELRLRERLPAGDSAAQ